METIVSVVVVLLMILGIIILLMRLSKDVKMSPDANLQRIASEASYLHRYQTYDKHPYSYHLQKVAEIAKKYWDFYGDDPKLHEALWMAAWFHDTIEDVPSYSYNDVLRFALQFFGAENRLYAEIVANVVYACTTEKGKTRKERANDKYYQGIHDTGYAPFIKACDRLANLEYSTSIGSTLSKAYVKELPIFLQKIENPDNPIPPKLKEALCQYLPV